MRVLALDTATSLTAVALRDIETAANICLASALDLAAADVPPAGGRPGHATRLLPLIHQLLEASDASWESIDRIAVGAGPGTFTGMRIGIATAQALAAAAGLPLVGVSTLQSLALAAHDRQPREAKLAVIDARRGEAFAAGWGVGEDPLRVEPSLRPCVLAPEQLERLASGMGAGTVAVGDGAVKFREILERAGARVPGADSPLHRISAREHCRIASLASPSQEATVEPLYLRLADAEIARAVAERA